MDELKKKFSVLNGPNLKNGAPFAQKLLPKAYHFFNEAKLWFYILI